MPKVTLEVEIPEDGDFRAAVIDAAVNRLLYGVSVDGEGYPHQIPSQLQKDIRTRYDEVIVALASAHAPKIYEELMELPVQSYNDWGDPIDRVSPKDTVKDKIRKAVENQLTRRRSGFHDGPTVLEGIIKEQVERTLKKELEAEVTAAKQQILKAVRDEAADVLTTALQRAVK